MPSRRLLALALTLAAAAPLRAGPVVLDTDLGNDVGDGLALALLMASPEVEIRGVTTVGATPDVRALMACRFVTFTGRRHVPVVAGLAPPGGRKVGGQYQYYYHPDVLFNRTKRPEKEGVVEFLDTRVQAQPNLVTLIAAGPLTNLAKFCEEKHKARTQVKRVVVNAAGVAADVKAAREVFASGMPLVVVPADVSAKLKLSAADRARLFAPATPLSQQTQALYQLGDEDEPALGDVLAAAIGVEDRFCAYEDRHVVIDDKGVLRTGNLDANAKVVTEVKAKEFIEWYVSRMASCVRPSDRPAKPVARGDMPHRVHVAEDFDTEIERRWWMAGKPETKNLPPSGGTRACRGVLTHDFDDLLGQTRRMWTAAIFNPVPGPPMGKRTRLNFNVWLDGSDELRVQIYSLTNGYHRHLVLEGVEKRKWQNLTVDMTQARRADGTGGPLSEGERIDDLQFYVEPTAELIVDDLFLYDAAPEGEGRPFPKRVHFTGWFDSGKQGKEWPGTFDVAFNKGFVGHAARAVEDEARPGESWVRLGLRGKRPLGERTSVRFRYLLNGAERIEVTLADGQRAKAATGTAARKGRWGEMTLDLTGDLRQADELRFRVGKGAELLVDDVLLYEPGR